MSLRRAVRRLPRGRALRCWRGVAGLAGARRTACWLLAVEAVFVAVVRSSAWSSIRALLRVARLRPARARSCSRTATSRRASARSASPRSTADRASTTAWSTRCATSACGCRSSSSSWRACCGESPAGIVVLDFDGRDRDGEPGGASGCCRPACAVLDGRPPRASSAAPLARDAGGAAPTARRACVAAVGRAPGALPARGTFLDRGFRAQLLPARGADRGAAAVREGGLREADPHDVARGQQHRRRVDSLLTRASPTRAQLGRRRPRATSSTRIGVVIARHRRSSTRSCAASPTSCGCRRRGGSCDAGGARGRPACGCSARVRERRRITCGARSARRTSVPVSMDRGQIEQALLNIVKNAIEAIGDGGHDHGAR